MLLKEENNVMEIVILAAGVMTMTSHHAPLDADAKMAKRKAERKAAEEES
jgi:hypothetical protein